MTMGVLCFETEAAAAITDSRVMFCCEYIERSPKIAGQYDLEFGP